MKKRIRNVFYLGLLMLSFIYQINGQVGELSVNGDFTLTSTGVYEAEIFNDSGAGFGHDRITVSEDLNLDGTLDISLIGYSPNIEHEFDVISYAGSVNGAFTTVIWPTDMINQGWEIDYGLLYPGTVTIYVPGSVLPIELISFTVRPAGSAHLLSWETSSEINNEYFSIECSFDNLDYFEIGKVKGAGNSAVSSKYSFVHEPDKAGIHYYRLKQIDFDGAYQYSEIFSIMNETKEVVSFFPNPSSNTITFSEEVTEITILDMSGSEVLSNTSPSTSYNVSTLPSGTYLIKVGKNDLLTDLLFINN